MSKYAPEKTIFTGNSSTLLPGIYVLNFLLVPLLSAGQNLFFNEVSDFKSIDKTWRIDMGKMEVASGEGFYKYPNPDYQNPDFLIS